MVYIRFIFSTEELLKLCAEALNMNAKWDSVARKVTLEDGATKIEIPVNTKNIVVNEKTFVGDTMPIVQNGRVLLSIGNIVKALGESKISVNWIQATQEIVIKR